MRVAGVGDRLSQTQVLSVCRVKESAMSTKYTNIVVNCIVKCQYFCNNILNSKRSKQPAATVITPIFFLGVCFGARLIIAAARFGLRACVKWFGSSAEIEYVRDVNCC